MAKRKAKLPELHPGDVYVAEPGTLDARALRDALAIVCVDPVLAAQIRRDMHVEPAQTVAEAETVARTRRAAMTGTVSAVIPNYNYGRFLGQAIDSLLAQTRPPDEIIVVDDASTDDSAQVARSYGDRVRLIRHARNTGNVGGPRNTGIAAASGEFVITLDSDDMVEPAYVETLRAALMKRPGIGVAYAGVQTHVEPDGQRVIHHDWPIPFDWRWQTAAVTPPHTCIPTASMFRREMWRRAGGYDAARISAEDAEFWPRALGCGFEAVKATGDPLFIYRRHGPSMSGRPITPLSTWSPMHRGWRPLAAPTGQPIALRDYTRPAVSVIIPVGPGHAKHLPSAIHSVIGQTAWAWEIVVVNDSGEALPLDPYPFVRVVDTGPRAGAGAARNAGMRAAVAPLVFFLDADDVILPRTLELMLRRYAEGDAGYVFSGWWFVQDGKPPVENIAAEWWPEAWLDYSATGIHGVSVLIGREEALRIGGFDESLAGFEDWEFFVRCAITGLHGRRVPDALLAYRLSTGARRVEAMKRKAEVVDYLRSQHGDFIEHRRDIMACCGGSQAGVVAAGEVVSNRTMPMLEDDGRVLMEFTGPYEGPVTYFGAYTGCKGCVAVPVPNGDWQRLEATGMWRIVRPEMPFIPAPGIDAPVPVEAEGE
jgi:glycosyltransferase involved in cell wall biosynthesis